MSEVPRLVRGGATQGLPSPCSVPVSPCAGAPSVGGSQAVWRWHSARLQHSCRPSLRLRRILQEGRASSLLSCQYIVCMLEVWGPEVWGLGLWHPGRSEEFPETGERGTPRKAADSAGGKLEGRLPMPWGCCQWGWGGHFHGLDNASSETSISQTSVTIPPSSWVLRPTCTPAYVIF